MESPERSPSRSSSRSLRGRPKKKKSTAQLRREEEDKELAEHDADLIYPAIPRQEHSPASKRVLRKVQLDCPEELSDFKLKPWDESDYHEEESPRIEPHSRPIQMAKMQRWMRLMTQEPWIVILIASTVLPLAWWCIKNQPINLSSRIHDFTDTMSEKVTEKASDTWDQMSDRIVDTWDAISDPRNAINKTTSTYDAFWTLPSSHQYGRKVKEATVQNVYGEPFDLLNQTKRIYSDLSETARQIDEATAQVIRDIDPRRTLYGKLSCAFGRDQIDCEVSRALRGLRRDLQRTGIDTTNIAIDSTWKNTCVDFLKAKLRIEVVRLDGRKKANYGSAGEVPLTREQSLVEEYEDLSIILLTTRRKITTLTNDYPPLLTALNTLNIQTPQTTQSHLTTLHTNMHKLHSLQQPIRSLEKALMQLSIESSETNDIQHNSKTQTHTKWSVKKGIEMSKEMNRLSERVDCSVVRDGRGDDVNVNGKIKVEMEMRRRKRPGWMNDV